MLVDTHMHLAKYPEHFNKDRPTFYTTGSRLDAPIERYVAEEGMVDGAIVVGMKAWNTLGKDVPNDYLAENAQKYPDKFAWCCCVNPAAEGAVEEIERCVKELGAIGLGEMCPSGGAYYANDRKCYPIYEKAVDLGIPMVIHAGPMYHDTARMAQGNVLSIDDVAIDFPELKIVINHMGWPTYEATCFLLQKHKNVFADISVLSMLSGLDKKYILPGLPVVQFPYFHLLYPLLYFFTGAKGDPDKLLFGSDWPVASPTKYIEILSDLNTLMKKHGLPEIPELFIHNILHENWKKVFGNAFKQ